MLATAVETTIREELDGDYFTEILRDFGLDLSALPDLHARPGGPAWLPDHAGPQGGMPRLAPALPIGVAQTDVLFDLLEQRSGRPIPARHLEERERLIDAFLDASRNLVDRRAIVCGEEGLVVGLVSLLAEMGIAPVLCATEGASGRLRQTIIESEPELAPRIVVLEGRDFEELEERAARLRPDFVIGDGLAYSLARSLNVPLAPVGFFHGGPAEDASLHVGYRGARRIFDRILTALGIFHGDAADA